MPYDLAQPKQPNKGQCVVSPEFPSDCYSMTSRSPSDRVFLLSSSCWAKPNIQRNKLIN